MSNIYQSTKSRSLELSCRSVCVTHLLMEPVAGLECVLDGVLVVRRVQVKDVHTLCAQPLQRRVQLIHHTLRSQCFPLPGVRFSRDSNCQHTSNMIQNKLPFRLCDHTGIIITGMSENIIAYIIIILNTLFLIVSCHF